MQAVGPFSLQLNQEATCTYACTSWEQVREPLSMYSCAASIVSSTTGTGGDPEVQYPPAALTVTA